MKNAILIAGAVAAIIGLQVVSYRAGVLDGQSREKYGKCLNELLTEMAVLTTFVHKIQTDVVKAKA